MIITGLVASINLFVIMIDDYGKYKHLVKRSLFNSNENIALIFNCINVVVDPFAISFIVDLTFYHLWLRLKKITTYEHIL